MRAVIYWRYSKDEQSVYSDAAQIRACKEYAVAKGLTVVGIYGDPGRSGKSTQKRPGFRKMMADALGKRFDVIIVHKLDRYSRNLVDVFSSLGELTKAGVTLVSVTESAFDFTTPQGRLFLGMLALFGQWYIENLAQETKKGKKERAQQGGWNGGLPFGYTTVKAIRECIQEGCPDASALQAYLDTLTYERETDAVFELHDIEGYCLAAKLYRTGLHSDRDIAEALNKEGYRTSGHWGSRPFSKDTVTPILRNRFYAGWVQYKGEWMRGRHPAAITDKEWEELQMVRRQRACRPQTTKKNDRVYPLRKVARCAECGTTLRGHAARGKRHYRDPAHDYGTECTQKTTTPALEVESQLGEFLASFHLPKDWREQVLRLIEKKAGDPDPDKEERARLESRLENLKQLFEWGDVKKQEYLAKRGRIKAELAELRPPSNVTLDLDHAAELLCDTEVLWDTATDRERLGLVRMIFNTIWIRERRIIGVEPKLVFYEVMMVCQEDEERQTSGKRLETDECMSDGNVAPVAPASSNSARHTEAGSFWCGDLDECHPC